MWFKNQLWTPLISPHNGTENHPVQSSSPSSSKSDIKTITLASGTSDATAKESCVWKYFKVAEIQGTTCNLCQANKIPGGWREAICWQTWINKKHDQSLGFYPWDPLWWSWDWSNLTFHEANKPKGTQEAWTRHLESSRSPVFHFIKYPLSGCRKQNF